MLQNLLFASLPVCNFVLKLSSLGSITLVFAVSADRSLKFATTAHQYAGGEHTGAIRCTQRHQPSIPSFINAVSADTSLTAAGHFGGNIANSAKLAAHMTV